MELFEIGDNLQFYQTGWFVVLMLLFCCFPLGIILMWYYNKFNKPLRILITIFFIAAPIMYIIGTQMYINSVNRQIQDLYDSINQMFPY